MSLQGILYDKFWMINRDSRKKLSNSLLVEWNSNVYVNIHSYYRKELSFPASAEWYFIPYFTLRDTETLSQWSRTFFVYVTLRNIPSFIKIQQKALKFCQLELHFIVYFTLRDIPFLITIHEENFENLS